MEQEWQTTQNGDKCGWCNTGTLSLWQWGNYPFEADWLCSNPRCESHKALEEAAEADHQDFLQDHYLDEHGDWQRH